MGVFSGGLQDVPGFGAFCAEAYRREPVFTAAAAVLALIVLPTLAAMVLDRRILLGANAWIKPLKFEISLLVYLATLAWFAGWLPRDVVASTGYRLYAAAVVTAIALEMIWVAGAAGFGVASHYNRTQPALAAIYPVMGLIAIFLTSATLVYGVVILRDGASPLDPVFKLSVGVSLILTFVLTVAVASHMAARAGHSVGTQGPSAAVLPLMGWARTVGDLRVAHFFALHAMHVIPLFGLVAAWLLPPSAGLAAVALFSIAYTAFTIWTFAEALMGRPFLEGILTP